MSVLHKKALLVHAGILLLVPFLVNAANATPQHAPHKRPVKQEQAAPVPAPPPPPPTLEQMPAQPPKVMFSNGLLTIVAENSTLGDILRAVRVQTKAIVEIPPNATERVVTHIGPGTVSDVLTSLLNGSHFNYVMLGSPTHPGMVDRLILTSKAGATELGSAPAQAVQSQAAAVGSAADQSDMTPVDISDQPAEDATDDSANSEENPPSPGQQQVKTPEQLLRELQQQQLQQQQRGGQPNGDGQPAPTKPE
jgi:hypothetical protein